VRAALAGLLLACAFCARGAPPELLLELELEPERVYVGGEARLRLRLLRLPGMPYGALRAPALGDAAEVSERATVRRYELVRSGVTYQVLERTHVVVPRQAGRLVVPQAELERLMRSVGVEKRDAALAVKRSIEVRPVPAGAGEPWLPARRVTLEESWSPDLGALAVGAPVTRTVRLRAEGLAAERLPRLEMGAQPGLLPHHDLPELVTEVLEQGIEGCRVQRIVLMPLAEGEIELPALSVRWWDVVADAPRTATLAGRTLRLGPALVPDLPGEETAGVSDRAMLHGIAAAIALLCMAVLWDHLRTQPLREIRRQLRAACRRNRAGDARNALIEWWKLVQPGAPVPIVLRIGAEWGAGARAQLAALDAALYGGSAWDGKAFWRQVRPWVRRRVARRREAAPPALPALFRLQARGGAR